MRNILNFYFLVILISACTLSYTGQAQRKPNIILFFVDDLGWADVGYRNDAFYTPNIDQLKNDGMDFTRAYVATPTCSPSRASLLTGKEPVRLQMVRHITHEDRATGRNENKFNLWPADPAQMESINWLALEEETYAEVLKKQGYYNIFIGKWHLGHEPYHPIHQGFDEQFGTTNFGHPASYYPPFFKHLDPFTDSSNGEYLTDVLTERAEEFIREYDKDQPFMMSLWYYNVHGPHVGRRDFIERYKKAGWEDRYANYGAMVSAMDESIGRVRKVLRDEGMSDNTVIIFTSDQGGYFTNYPLRGKKNGGNTLGEGGARVPFMLLYPGHTKPGAVCQTPIQTIDVMPTLAEITTGQLYQNAQIQGKSILPLARNEDFKERNLYFFRSYEDQYAAVISGDWKLIKYHSGVFQLYNLREDESEVNNQIFVRSKIANQLKKDLANWELVAVPND